MDPSPAGNEIEVVTGNAFGIRSRGQQIESLGEQMIGAAGVLRAIAGNGVPQEGLSIEKIKEVIGEIDEELKLAGERYRPSGAALIVYADALTDVQAQMRLIVPRCQTAWDDYIDARAAYQDANRPLMPWETGTPPLGGGLSPEQEAHNDGVAAAQVRSDDAYDAFTDEGRNFDAAYETWESAFNKAADDIQGATDGGISDGFWDNVDGIVAAVTVVLQWAGIALAVLAFVIGGPIIALAGAIVAVAALALTAYQFGRGDANGWDLALAIVGVIPFGSLAKFSGGFSKGATGFVEGLTGGLATSAGRSTLRTAFSTMPDVFATSRVFGASRFTAFTAAMRGSYESWDLAPRIMGMADAGEMRDALAGSGWGVAGIVTGHYGWIVNAPFTAGKAVFDTIGDLVSAGTVQTWETQLANS
ncbi:hypothetical protein [Agromyces italicus]|uniref:hypothetical protein n=1 Tax=Agromyces italicus TaxID=279572 RepID=UPI0003B6BD78|nr:hypothetical protein [Agromyces italicus]